MMRPTPSPVRLTDEALHGPKKLWGGDESVSLELLRRLLRREGSTISLSAFLRTHQRLVGGAFPLKDADLALSLSVEINGASRRCLRVPWNRAGPL